MDVGFYEALGYCIFAVLFSMVAYLLAGKGRIYMALLIAGLVWYVTAVGFFYSKGTKGIISLIISLILLVVMFPICEWKRKRKLKGKEKEQTQNETV